MNILLDTHVLLWWLADDRALSKKAREKMSNIDNIIFVSSASIWEITIKKKLSKLTAPDNLHQIIIDNQFEPLPISLQHAENLLLLPPHHDDPFDRLLLSQAQIENCHLMTHDKQLKQYDVNLLFV